MNTLLVCYNGTNKDLLTQLHYVGLYVRSRPSNDETCQENQTITDLASLLMANVWLHASSCQASSCQWLTHLKFDQANFSASWKFWSSSSSTPVKHFINLLVSFSVSLSKVLQCAMLMLTVVLLLLASRYEQLHAAKLAVRGWSGGPESWSAARKGRC